MSGVSSSSSGHSREVRGGGGRKTRERVSWIVGSGWDRRGRRGGSEVEVAVWCETSGVVEEAEQGWKGLGVREEVEVELVLEEVCEDGHLVVGEIRGLGLPILGFGMKIDREEVGVGNTGQSPLRHWEVLWG